VNANAGRVRREPALIDAIAQVVAPPLVEVVYRAEEARAALEALREEGAGTVAIVGGDGSVTGTLTPLIEAWSAAGLALPRVALLPGGSVNTIPSALGGSGSPATLLRRLAAHGPRRTRALPALRVLAGDAAPRYGMIFGNGAVTRWLDHYYSREDRGPGGAARTLVDALGSVAMRGRLAHDLFVPWYAKVEVDGAAASVERFTAMAAGALPDIGLGFKPFRSAGQDPGRFHWIMTGAGPLRMGLEVGLVALRLGGLSSALRHASPARVVVHCASAHRYTVDGDVFRAVDRFEISAGPTIEFVAA
jgi:diacylglycerol kinase family enzyme